MTVAMLGAVIGPLPSRAAPACTSGFGDGSPTIKTITMDGAFGDWTNVLADLDNVACDGYSGGPVDADSPGSHSLDLIALAWTWDSTYFYGYSTRAGDSNAFQKYVMYADTDHDGKMETGEPAMVLHWKGSSRSVEVAIGVYTAATSGGDPMVNSSGKADGYTLPGDISSLSPSTPQTWGSIDGTQMEWRVNLSNAPTNPVEAGLGMTATDFFQWHMASSNKEPDAANFPANVDDNMGGQGGYIGTSRFAAVNASPNSTVQVSGGDSVSLAHTVANVGNGSDVVDVTTATTPFTVSGGSPAVLGLYRDVNANGQYDPGTDTLLTDTDADGVIDTGILSSGGSVNIIVLASVPASLSAADTSTVAVTARSSYVAPGDTLPRVTATATDTLVSKTADIGLQKSVDVSAPPLGSDVIFTMVATNHGPSSATEVIATDHLPSGITYIAHSGDGSYDLTTGIWNIGALGSGGTATVHITARVGSAALPTATNTITRTSQNEFDGNAANDTASITVTPTHAPTANDDAYAVDENSTLAQSAPGVLTNDTDSDVGPLSANLISSTTHGALTLQADGSFTYVPSAHFYGTDSFTYRANDGILPSATATVTLTVNRRDIAPVATDDSFTVMRDTPSSIPAPGVLANDSDVDGNPIVAQLVSGVSHGSLSLHEDGSFDYTPSGGFEGTDSFTYRASDGALTSNVATVTIDVVHSHIQPTALPDSYSVAQDTTLAVTDPGIMANDQEPDGDTIWPIVVSSVSNGTLDVATGGGFTYVPSSGFVGTDSFTYYVTDGFLDSSTTTVTITVSGINRSPIAVDDSYTVAQDDVLSVNPPGALTNDSDPDSNPLTASLVSSPLHGLLSFGNDGGFTYTPTMGYSGSDSFSYKAYDGRLHSGTATVQLTVTAGPANRVPVAVTDKYEIAENATLNVPAPGVLSNDSDADGDTMTAEMVDGVSFGTLNVASNGGFDYRPNQYFDGTDSFSYRVTDGRSYSDIVYVQIRVTPVNYVPVASNDDYAVVSGSNVTVQAPGLLKNDHDPDGDPITSILTSGVVHGTLTSSFDGSFSYTSDPGFIGTDYFTYVANDGVLSSNQATVAINVTPAGGNSSGEIFTPIEASVEFAAPAICAPGRDVTLILHAHNADRMMISNSPDFADAVWQPYASNLNAVSKAWTLADTDGMQTVYVKFSLSHVLGYPSHVVTASILLDQAGQCGDVATAAKSIDQCAVDYADMEIHPHIMNPDGSERHEGDLLVRVSRTASDTLRYAFDDSGSDMDYNDAIIDVKVTGRKAHLTLVEVSADYRHGIKLHIHHHGKVLDDIVMWNDSHFANGKTFAFDLDAALASCRGGRASSLKPGDLIKGNGSAVYFLGKDGKRHVFTSRPVYDSWYSDFSKVHRLSDEELSIIPLGTNVTSRPGQRLIKFITSPKVYAVDFGGQLRWIREESDVIGIYGSRWQASLITLHDSVFTDYSEGPSVSRPEAFPSRTISAQSPQIPL